jgi:hypothetical protein
VKTTTILTKTIAIVGTPEKKNRYETGGGEKTSPPHRRRMNMVEMAGFTFDRAKIGQIVGEIERQKKSKKDFVGDSRYLSVTPAEGQMSLRVDIKKASQIGEADLFNLTRTGRVQLANALRIPMTLWERMEKDPKHQGRLGELATHFLREEPTDRLVRTLDGKMRAFLSPRYRTLDNSDLFFVAAEEFQKAGAEIWDARLSEDGFRLYAVQPGISARVDDGAEGNKFDAGDEHIAAVSIQNSETGRGKMKVRPCTLRKVCWNWNVWDESLSQIHLGREREEEGWISEDTQRLEDKVIWAKVKDIVSTAFDKKKFEEVIAKLRGAKADKDPDPVKTVDAAVEFTGLPQGSMDAIRAKYIGDKDFTRYGLVQAVTFQAHGNVSDEEKDAFDDAGAKILATVLKDI